MAFSRLVLKEMIIKSIVFLILLQLIIANVIQKSTERPEDLVFCSNRSGYIKTEEVCIEYHDCVDKDNKSICHYCSPEATHTIACVTVDSQLTFECLSPHQICDNKTDCLKKEDEDSCGITKCRLDSWLCTNGTCIDRNKVCDEHKDCPDGSDEGDICHEHICGVNKIRCPTGECIPKSKMCDGIAHCSDNYDEKDCKHTTSTTLPMLLSVTDSDLIPSNTFDCLITSSFTHSIRISKDQFCDRYEDCPKGDDERDCITNCTSKSICPANSDVICIQHPSMDQLCRCEKKGYRLTTRNNTQICQDFDECNDSFGTYCSFECANTDGSFNCTCPLGFTIDKQTKACRATNNSSKPNFLVLFDDNISLYNIQNTNDQYTSNILNTIKIANNQHFDYLKYDPNQMFIIYYDSIQHAVLCQSIGALKPIVLLSNLTVQGFAYNANEKILFLIDNQTQSLRMYTPIICASSVNIQMHSWSLINISNSIHSLDIDFYNGQLLFASNYQILISNMSEPTSTKVVYTSDREIKRFIYDTSFRRIFWTSTNTINDALFPVYTCDNKFKQCHDTSIRLPLAWPFAFFNDGLLYTSLSQKALGMIQLYGKRRFSTDAITSTQNKIRSILLTDEQRTISSNPCKTDSATGCKDQLCLQINTIEKTCLSIDANIASSMSTANSISQSVIQENNNISVVANQPKTYSYRSWKTILLCSILIGVVVTIITYNFKRCQNSFNRKLSQNGQNLTQQYLSTDEPNLDEFSVMVEERNGDRLPLTNHLQH